MCPGEGLLKFLQLEAGKGRSVAALFSLGRVIVRLRLTLGAGRRRSWMDTLFFGFHFFSGDAHLRGLRRSRR